MVMHSPFTNGFPYYVWAHMRRSRKNKDIGDKFCHFINNTGVYDLFLKRTGTYLTFGTGFTLLASFGFGRVFDRLWCYWNKGALYKDNIYVYPPEEDDDE